MTTSILNAREPAQAKRAKLAPRTPRTRRVATKVGQLHVEDHGGREDLIPHLAEIAVAETVFFAGTDDRIFPREEARAQAEAIPKCRFIAVERSAHRNGATGCRSPCRA